MAAPTVATVYNVPEDGNEEQCGACGLPGSLLCCEVLPSCVPRWSAQATVRMSLSYPTTSAQSGTLCTLMPPLCHPYCLRRFANR